MTHRKNPITELFKEQEMSKPDKQHNPYKYICITFAICLTVTMYYYGAPAVLDDIAAWRNNGMAAEDARCAMAFDLDVAP